MMLFSVYVGLFGIHLCRASGVLNKLNDYGYDQMPPLISVDDYAACLRMRGSYCFVRAKLFGNGSHPLYNALVEHSSKTKTHFNRTVVHRGICLKTCDGYSDSQNITESVETCLNSTLIRDYNLTSRVFEIFCSVYGESIEFDMSDYMFGAVVLIILVLNLLGSLYDVCKLGETPVDKLLLCFSVRRNWKQLVKRQEGPPQLYCISAYRVIIALGVVMAHGYITIIHAIQNPERIEKNYEHLSNYILLCGLTFVQIFVILSATLLSYFALKSEKHVIWQNLPKAMVWRWLRITPTYALMLFFVATWMRHLGEGPFWGATIALEARDCRRDWLLHLLYVNNYVDHSHCNLHSWYLATDMQLTLLGLAIFFLLKSDKARKVAIALALIVGLVAPAATTYYYNLPPIIIVSPEITLSFFIHDPTFINLYKRGHNNLVCYALGLALGYVIHNLNDSDIGAEKYKKYAVLRRSLLPLMFATVMTGAVFYSDDLEVPLLTRAIYASTIKFTIGALLCLHIFLTVVRADYVSNWTSSWRIWVPLARLSYCMFCVHMIVLRFNSGTTKTLIRSSYSGLYLNLAWNTIILILFALPLFLLVETPIAQVIKLYLMPVKRQKQHTS